MVYRKFKADLLFTGTEMLSDGTVLVAEETGKMVALVSAKEAGENIETVEGMITPGLVNTHCHVELSHMKGVIPQPTGLVPFLIRVIKERAFPQEVIDEAILKAIKELEASGTVAVGDICNTAQTIAAKNNSHINWHNFVEVMGFTEKPQDRFDFAATLLRDFELCHRRPDNGSATFRSSFAPHAPYSVSESLFRLINNAAGHVLSIHNQETKAENNWYHSKSGGLTELYKSLNIDPQFFRPSGKTSLQTYLPLLNRSKNLLLVHNTFISEEDLQFTIHLENETAQHVFFATCINANLYIESIPPPLTLLKQAGVKICLGTDSYASNHSLQLLEEMKSIQHHFPFISLTEMLTWATINGAKALQMDKWLGSFETGKYPWVVQITNIKDGKLTQQSSSRRLL